MTITIGTDFEVALKDQNGNPVSGVGLIGGTKEKPLDIGNGCGKQEDNVNAEFTIPPVVLRDKNGINSEAFEQFCDYINYCIETVDVAPYQYAFESSNVYSEDELNSPQAQEFGCAPSHCPYTQSDNYAEPDTNLRTAGFHIHFGMNTLVDNIPNCERFSKLFDKYVVYPSLELDQDTRRRELYGKPGDFRFKPYGIEVRSLGMGVIATDGVLDFSKLEAVWEMIMNTITQYEAGEVIEDNKFQSLINNYKCELQHTEV